MPRPTSLKDYRLLGRSGLRISPFSLGTMTFGETWGADEAESRRMFDLYRDHGGNSIDTANIYSGGASETLVGKFLEKTRHDLVLATKYSLSAGNGDPNSGGNHRKSMMRAVEDSLKRLKTDYIDLYYLHIWDSMTMVDEILRAFDDLVSQGKILYVGISDTPAWQVSRLQTMADLRGWAPLVALQIEYSLVERSADRDLWPMARELGLGGLPWSPLGSGVLSGKYTRADLDGPGADAEGRKAGVLHSGRLTERVLDIAEVVKKIAGELGKTPAQIALAWTLENPAVTSPILGARTLAQLQDNLGALDVEFSADQLAELDAASRIQLGFPHDFLNGFVKPRVAGGAKIEPRS